MEDQLNEDPNLDLREICQMMIQMLSLRDLMEEELALDLERDQLDEDPNVDWIIEDHAKGDSMQDLMLQLSD